MMFKTLTLIALSAAMPTTLIGCGSTQTRADAPAAAVSDEPVYAERAEMRVDGLGCPMCAESISIVLGGVDAVEDSRVDLSSGIVYVDLDPTKAVTAGALRSAIDDGGFTFRSISFEK